MSQALKGGTHNPYPVTPTGFLIGSYFACFLYGLHQVHYYFSTFTLDTWRTRLFVIWIWTLSSFQMVIIIVTSHRYFVRGIEDTEIWNRFWWPLSIQDGLIPLMAYTAQLYFGRRAWLVLGKRRYFKFLYITMSTITFAAGISLAVRARLWAADPFLSTPAWDHLTKTIGIPSQAVALTWMGLSALIDGSLTVILLTHFIRVRRAAPVFSGNVISRLVALTLETVLLTHIVGAAMCIIFFASPPAHRTRNDFFWFLIEVVTELYALSVLFTINSRSPVRIKAFSAPLEEESNAETVIQVTESGIERAVEGRNSIGFGIVLSPVLYRGNQTGQTSSSGMEMGSIPGFGTNSTSGSGDVESPDVDTPGDELVMFGLVPQQHGGKGDWDD